MSDYERARPRSAAPAMSSAGVAAIVATVFALAIGFVVLRRINNEAGSVTSLGNGSASAVGNGSGNVGPPPVDSVTDGTTVDTLIPGPTVPPSPTTFAGAVVIVANANGTERSASKATTVLQQSTSFELGDPTDQTAEKALPKSIVYFDPAAVATTQPVAENLARVLGGIQVQALPSADVVSKIGDAGVVLMLGTDFAALSKSDLVPPLTDTEVDAANSVLGGTPTTVTEATS